MNDLVLEPRTAKQVADFTAQPAQALLLIGPAGSGKIALANAIAADILGVDAGKLAKQPYVHYVSPTNGTLSIEDIRKLQSLLQLKTLGTPTIRRVVIIENAEGLTTEAQNALLKSLEEPPADTIIILTVTSLRALLPTIISRTQHITLKAPTLEALQNHFKPQFSESAVGRAYLLSEGLPGLMTALLEENDEHPLVAAVETVKQWLRAPAFERLLFVDQLAKQKADIDILLVGLERVSQAALLQAAAKQQVSAVKRWQHILALSIETRRAYAKSAQPKLLLTHLMLEL